MLSGEWVGLRAIERDDLAQLLAWRNRPEMRRYFREYRELGGDQQNAWYENVVLKDPATRMFSIVELASGRLLGACGLCYINWVDRNADFSIYLGADDLYIDTRLAPDAARVLMRYGFDELGLHRLWSEIYAFDTQKQALFDTLGFRQEARYRESHWTEGGWQDALIYARLVHDAR
jgi:RimJ/RimL family protein N-acetyltransferase